MPNVDFVVIGSGAAGGVMAKELAEAGFRVVVLEQGPYLKEKDFTHDEVHYVRHQGLTNDQKVQPVLFRRNDGETAQPWKAIAYGRQVGGGTVHFAANYWRFHESDFHEHSTFGDVPGSSFTDWPITYADLEPFYAKAERDIGVSGLAGANPFEAPRSGPYPLPPMPVKSSGVLFDRGAKKLGLHPFPAPVAILSQPYQGRGACTHCGWCQWFGCEMRAKSSTLATVIPQAVKTGRCEVRANAYVRRIQTDKTGRVTGVVYFDAKRKEVFLKAKGVVLCANGVESPRLLLLSKSNRFPNGLANSSGLVGRNLMWDNSHGVQALFEHPLHDYKSIRVTRVLHDFYRADAKRGFYGGGAMDARFGSFPAAFALNGLPAGTPRWGLEYKKALAEYFPRTMMVVGHSTSLPVENNRVDLDPQAKDAWGLPAVRITFDFHPDDQKTARWLWDKQIAILEAAGARRIWGEYNDKPGLSAHLMGTCRMGTDPQRSVVNTWSRAHDVPNLWVVDGSNFVTSARQQPTATIQALAYRAAAGIVEASRRGEL
ncbi:MAG: GMC family oxidoreductase [Bryobacterales bacterium]|nr:GMC family oxidoreductase [Bryobacterales bacterium]